MSDRYLKREELPEVYIKKPLEWEEFFQKEEHVAFSPATQGFTIENLVLVLFIVKLSKTPEGIKHLKDLAVKYLDSCARIVESVENACHSNWLTALNNQFIAATISHRIGLMDDGGYLKTITHYRSVFDKMLEKSYVVEGLTTLVQGVSAAAGLSDVIAAIKGVTP